MERLSFCVLAISVLAGNLLLAACADAQPKLPGAMRVRESKPVTVNDAQFVVVAQTDWTPGKPWDNYTTQIKCIVAPVDIQLRITNLGKKPTVFATSGTFGLKIYDVNGREIKPRHVRNGTASTKPILLPAGTSFSLHRRAELHWNEKTKASELMYYDGTGTQSIVGPLPPGRYKLASWYAVTAEKQAKQQAIGTTDWIGEAVTDEVLVEIFDDTTRGLPLEPESPLKAFKQILRVRESKLVNVKEASFVVVAESDWKPGKDSVPIDIQLRITNLSKRDVIFPTFDTFGLIVKNADGKRIMPRGGRNLTKFTRPVLIPGGTSYSLGTQGSASLTTVRRAELRWDEGAKSNELVYWDGTGSEHYFGPLFPGRYRLSFFYAVTRNEPIVKVWESGDKVAGEVSTWQGVAVTEEVFIDVLDR